MLRCWKSESLGLVLRKYSTKSVRYKSAASSFPRVREETFDPTNNVVRSPFDIQVPDLNLADFIWRNIGRYLDEPAMTCGLTGRSYKYKEARGASFNFSVSLLNVLGLKPGDVLGMLMPNVPEFPMVFLGAASAGLIVTPANPLYTPGELAHQFSDAGVSAVVTVAPLLKKVQATLALMPGGGGPIIVAGMDSEKEKDLFSLQELMMRLVSRADHQPDQPDPESLVALPYSSGTTGVPKGVMLSHRNMVSSISQMDHPEMVAASPPGSPQDRVLAVLPFFHIYGLQGALNLCLSRGHHITTVPRFEPESFSEVFHKFKPTMVALVPPLVQFLTKSPSISTEDLQHLRLTTSGAAPLAKQHIEDYLAKVNKKDFIFKEAYGLTETACMATMMPNIYQPEKAGSCGIPAPLTEMKVVDESGRALPIGETGELMMRGPNVMKGYLNNEHATTDTLLEDGWLMTGDLACIDQDCFVYLVDRMKELIKVKGLQVSPTELEEKLSKMEGIVDVAVIGVPDEKCGEVPKAFVVKKKDSSITEEQVRAFLEPQVATFKYLKGGVQFISEIPKNAAGKVLRKELKKLKM